jgi:hypothetical protein
MQLFDWVRSQNVSISQLSRNIGVERAMIYRYFAGAIPRTSTIRRIEKITRGKVTAQDFYLNALARDRLADEAARTGAAMQALPRGRVAMRGFVKKISTGVAEGGPNDDKSDRKTAPPPHSSCCTDLC